MVLEITTGFMTHFTTRGLKSCKTFPPLDQISVKALAAERVAHVGSFPFQPLQTFIPKNLNCLDMDRKRIHETENFSNVYSFQKSRKYCWKTLLHLPLELLNRFD